LARVWTATTEDLASLYGSICTLQLAGAGIFFQVNHGSARGKAHVDRVRALFIDSDGHGLLDLAIRYMPKPTAMVVSSFGRWHAYWSVRDCPLEEFKGRQETLAEVLGTDRSVSNLDRVMRLPGTWNLKAEPRRVLCSV